MGLDVPQPAVLYTSQSLTSAQAAQAQTNLNGALGLTGDWKFADGAGLTFFRTGGTAVGARIWYDTSHPDELHVEANRSIYLGPSDATAASFWIQAGAAGGLSSHDPDVMGVYVPPIDIANANGELFPSQNLLLTTTSMTGDVLAYGGVRLRGVVLDVSKNCAFQVAKNDLSGYSANAAVIQAENGVPTICAFGFIDDHDMGMLKDTTTLVLQANATDGRIGIGSGLLSGRDHGQQMRFRTGYFENANDLALQLYYANAGLGVISATEWFAAAGDAKIFSVLTAGLRLESGKTLQLGNAAAAAVAVASTHKLRLLDSTGTAYDVLAVAA